MKKLYNIEQLRKKFFDVAVFSSETVAWIEKENLWNLWVPENYGGLEASFSEGLQKLKTLAKTDGSLGWTVTLCSGANYFIGNFDKEVADEIFLRSKPAILGGSGGVFGTAEKLENGYKISGKWRYATGAPYLSHFTLNAKIMMNGEEVKEADGSPKVRSFVLPKEKVKLISDWNTMGLKATATHSFEVDAFVDEKYAFQYNHFNLPHSIFKIPFSLFADMTLWVNYLGMAEHFLEEVSNILPKEALKNLTNVVSETNKEAFRLSEEIENSIQQSEQFAEAYKEKIHSIAADSVRDITRLIIEIYPKLGIKACRTNHQLNQIFRDYFTATQHHIFSR
ncbi:acyl-CoA dehydrogenase [Aequorivita marina]|uniref:acyl-CoA dehydrogenase n=1 Tax=Aequorivita marina TaxID=3073654 RepID=UPI002875699B|nr:acyl-CoA dehydrogenase [Aequorivita sp. S2608]MDS1299618.1 acyl-CoA dehydrogenase [Aequorivita sp. S2608]